MHKCPHSIRKRRLVYRCMSLQSCHLARNVAQNLMQSVVKQPQGNHQGLGAIYTDSLLILYTVLQFVTT